MFRKDQRLFALRSFRVRVIGIRGLAAFEGRVDFGKRLEQVCAKLAGALLVDRQGQSSGVLDDLRDPRSVFRFPYGRSRRLGFLRRGCGKDRVETFI